MSRIPPKPEELIQVLKNEFSRNYTYQLLGLGPERTIMVSSNWLVGAQISCRENEITVEGTFSSVITSILGNLILMITFGYGLPSIPWKIEKKLSAFIKRKYGYSYN